MKKKKTEPIIYSKKDQNLFDEFLIMLSGGLGALGLEDIIAVNIKSGLIKLGIAFLIILFVLSIIRKISDKIKAK